MEYNYKALQYVNNSALSFINPDEGGNPEKYRNYVLTGESGKNESYFALGTNLHFVFLEKKDPIVINNLPSPAIKDIVDPIIDEIVFKLKKPSPNKPSILIEDYGEALLKAARAAKYQNRWTDDTLKANLIGAVKEYWDIIINTTDVPIVNQQQKALIQSIRANIELRPHVKELLATPEEKDTEYFTEFTVIWEEDYTGKNMKCKSKLDRVRLCHKTKTFSIRDFKTTGKVLEYFPGSFESYRYYRQIKFYEKAFMAYLNSKGMSDYRPSTHYIIAAETAPSGRIQSFEVTAPYLFKGDMEIDSLLNRIAKHEEDNQWIFSLEEQSTMHVKLIPASY